LAETTSPAAGPLAPAAPAVHTPEGVPTSHAEPDAPVRTERVGDVVCVRERPYLLSVADARDTGPAVWNAWLRWRTYSGSVDWK